MGYTHYWTFKQVKRKAGEAEKIEKRYQKAIAACQKIIQFYNTTIKKIDQKHPDRLSGYSAHSSNYGGISVNGTKDLAHEDFILREHYKQNLEDTYWGFCKTAQKPYDKVIVACLIALNYYLKDQIVIDSDGDASDWVTGLFLAKQVLKLKNLDFPDNIKAKQSLYLVG